MTDIGYIKGIGIWYQRELNTIKKKDDIYLQPVFEAFTNSLESILIQKEKYNHFGKGEITINVFLTKNLFSKDTVEYDFQKIVIEDSGIGFEDSEFERFVNLRDDRKSFSNKGTGRVQFLHMFDKTTIISTYIDEKSTTGFKIRKLTISKNVAFLKNNSIIRLDEEGEIHAVSPKTTVIFESILEPRDTEFYKKITATVIKEQLIRHYLAGFCEIRDNLPEIQISTFLNDKVESQLKIESKDIPIPDQEKPIEVYYSKIDGNSIVKTSNKETFNLKSFIVPESELEKNGLKLVSKGEVARDIRLENLLPNDHIDGKRYLFLLSGKFIDERDCDNRGEINILKRKDFKKNNSDSFFVKEEVLLEDIEEKTNQTILSIYKEIEERSKEKEKSIQELQEMFLLNPKTLRSLQNKINIGDSDETILRKVYEADAKIAADKDAEIKQQIKDLEKQIDTRDEDYQGKLTARVNEFIKAIPLQNRTALSQYVARRKIVLELFDKILNKELENIKTSGRIDEDLLHNLIFQQSSDEPETSDLWLINEEFIYYKGTSESKLGNLSIDGENVFKEKLTKEEVDYRLKQNSDAKLRRTDILLFPKEGKCIIIELKAPDINISEHLNQINRYASLINNLSKDKFHFNTYYGYLIGESINIDDIEDNDTDFISAHSLNFIFRPYKRIAGKFGKGNGSLYTEIIKYSTLIERAKQRNKIFIDKLEGTSNL
ncbi:MAG: hypothetical protein AB9846_17790 [Tenuifilaceae bacterium]